MCIRDRIVSQPEFDDDRTRALRSELRDSGSQATARGPGAGERLVPGPGRTVLAHLERAVSEDLVEIRERLDVLLGRTPWDREALAAVAEKLVRLADTILIAGHRAGSTKAHGIAESLTGPGPSGSADEIATAAEEQSAVAEEINRNVVNVSQVAEQTASASAETHQASVDLSRQAQDLETLVQQFAVR